MAGIAGIAADNKQEMVNTMLDSIAHRGPDGRKVVSTGTTTMGVTWPKLQEDKCLRLLKLGVSADLNSRFQYAFAYNYNNQIVLERDPLGVKPLYYGLTSEGSLIFASEVKALLPFTHDIRLLPPGTQWMNGQERKLRPEERVQFDTDRPEWIATHLKRLIQQAVIRRISGPEVGSWLSGGLDSSAIAAMIQPNVRRLFTFAAGLPGSPDLENAKIVASYLHSDHYEVILDLDQMLKVLPEVIYHLETFDALLVRSSISNYLVGKMASDYVDEAFSGEGADELFGGYEYLKEFKMSDLPGELADITGRLHNTALQRVDRCASAHGLIVHVPLLDIRVFEYSRKIPPELKIKNGIEKWILRQAVVEMLPEEIVFRKKAKFWEGTGVSDLLECYAKAKISDADFQKERNLPNGWVLNTKEELLYYRIFHEHFGDLENLDWMGRTKGAPRV